MIGQPISRSYPLNWPAGRPRSSETSPALFRDETAASRRVSETVAIGRLRAQLDAMTKRGQIFRATNVVLSTAVPVTLDGRRMAGRREPDDQGAAVYFDLDKRPHVLACDKWDRLPDNIAAIAAHIEALRGQERWGVADLAQAFSGHTALPAPETCWQVLGLPSTASAADVDARYRELARKAHPAAGGSEAALARLNVARDNARKALT